MNMNLFESSPKDVTRLILVRHGRTSANQAGRIGAMKDYPLDETGKEQAARVARRLKRDFPIAVIYASPILRTKQTAQAVADEFGLGDIQFRDELKEYYFGMAADHTMEEIKEENEAVYNEMINWMNKEPGQTGPHLYIPGAELFEDFEARIRRFTAEILEKNPGQVVCAVSHMGLIKGFMAVHFGSGIQQRMNFNALNTSLTIIDFYKKIPVLAAFNDISHLDMPYPYGRVNLL